MGIFRTIERRQQLRQLAEHYHDWKNRFPELTNAKVLNRMHNEGIDASYPDLMEALDFEKEQHIQHPEVESYNSYEAALYIGVPEDVFKGWFLPSYAAKAIQKEGFIARPAGCPDLVRLNKGERGKPALFTAESVEAVHDFLQNEFPFESKGE